MFTLSTRRMRIAFRAAVAADAYGEALALQDRIVATEARIDRVVLVAKWAAITAAVVPPVHVLTQLIP